MFSPKVSMRVAIWCDSKPRKVLAKLRQILVLDRVHSQFPRALEIQSAIVDQDALAGLALRDLERELVNSRVRLAHPKIAGTEERLEIIAQLEFLDAVFVDFERFVVQRRHQVFS